MKQYANYSLKSHENILCQGRDPAAYKNLRVTHKLQHTLADNVRQVSETVNQIHDLDREYISLRQAVLAHPSPETVLQLKRYRQQFNDLQEQVKVG